MGMISFKLRAAPPAAYPAVRVQSYALKAMSDRGLTRTISANRRNVLPLAGEVIQIQNIIVYLQHDSDAGLKIRSFRRMFGHQSGHQSKRLKTGVCIQTVFQAYVHADG